MLACFGDPPTARLHRRRAEAHWRGGCVDPAETFNTPAANDNKGAIELLLKHSGQVDDAVEKLHATLAPLQKLTAWVH